MTKPKDRKPRDLTPLTAEEVREIGRLLAHAASQCAVAADEMDKSSIASLLVKGASNMSLTLERLNGGLQSLHTALVAARTASLRSKSQGEIVASQRSAARSIEAGRSKAQASRKSQGNSTH